VDSSNSPGWDGDDTFDGGCAVEAAREDGGLRWEVVTKEAKGVSRYPSQCLRGLLEEEEEDSNIEDDAPVLAHREGHHHEAVQDCRNARCPLNTDRCNLWLRGPRLNGEGLGIYRREASGNVERLWRLWRSQRDGGAFVRHHHS
jgi:hypothetical protein